MLDALLAALKTVVEGEDLSPATMEAATSEIMQGHASDARIAAFLTAVKMKGETVDEVVGAARAMRAHATKIPAAGQGLLDTCGTGGDALHTFNISTATALVAAAVGVPVAKHGNRSVSSSSGSADVLEALGVNIELPPDQVARSIEEVGIGFCFARLAHQAMKHVAPVRAQLGFRTIFNLLGPLTNPAGAEFQLLGASRTATAELLARALAELGATRALVVCGNDELDEVSLWGTTTVFRVENQSVNAENWTAADFGLSECRVEELRVTSADEGAERIRSVLSGNAGPSLDIVIANTAAALLAAGRCQSPSEGAEMAARAIASGEAMDCLNRLVEFTSQAGDA